MERMLLFAFLAESSGCEFREQLPFLQSRGLLCAVKGVQSYDSDGELQTDGNRSGHLQNGELGECSLLSHVPSVKVGGFVSIPLSLYYLVTDGWQYSLH